MWDKIFKFDTTSKKLTIVEYSGLPQEGIDQVNLMFQSKIRTGFTHKYHLLTVKLNQEVLQAPEPEPVVEKEPPQFISKLE